MNNILLYIVITFILSIDINTIKSDECFCDLKNEIDSVIKATSIDYSDSSWLKFSLILELHLDSSGNVKSVYIVQSNNSITYVKKSVLNYIRNLNFYCVYKPYFTSYGFTNKFYFHLNNNNKICH